MCNCYNLEDIKERLTQLDECSDEDDSDMEK